MPCRYSLCRDILKAVVQQLKVSIQECQKTFESCVRSQSLEKACSRTPESFCVADYISWSRQLHSAYRTDLERKEKSLQGIQYSCKSVAQIIATWMQSPQRPKGTGFILGVENVDDYLIADVLHNLHYTLNGRT